MTFEQQAAFIDAVLARVRYRDARFLTLVESGVVVLLVGMEVLNAENNTREVQYGGGFVIPQPLTEDTIIRTAFKAVLAFQEHEVREFFHVDGLAPFGPHTGIHQLLQAAKS